MDWEVTQVSKADLGQLRPPSEADIQQRIQAAARKPAHKETHRANMAQLEKAAMQFVALKQQDRQSPAPSPTRAARGASVNTRPRHNSVVQRSYAEPIAKRQRAQGRVPDHVAMQRTVQRHIQRNGQREARREQFRQLGQQIKAHVVASVKQVGQLARGVTQARSQPAPGRMQSVQAERAGKQPMHTMAQHREKPQAKARTTEKSRERASVRQPAPARQAQPSRGKEQDRGRTR